MGQLAQAARCFGYGLDGPGWAPRGVGMQILVQSILPRGVGMQILLQSILTKLVLGPLILL